MRRNQEAKIGTVPVAASSPPSPVFLFRRFVPRRAHHHHSPSHWLGFSVSRTSRPPARSMQAPPLAALAGGAWASHRPAILAAPASLRRPRRGALRLPAWRAAGGGRAPRLPAKGAVLASDTGADEEVAGPSPLLDVRSEQGLLLLSNAFLTRTFIKSRRGVIPEGQKSHLISFLFIHMKPSVACGVQSSFYASGRKWREGSCLQMLLTTLKTCTTTTRMR